MVPTALPARLQVKARLQDVVGRSLGAFEALYAAHNPSASLARLASLAASSRAAASSRGGDSSSRDCSSGEESEDSDDPLGLRRRGLLRSGSQDGADTEGGGVDSARSASPTVPLERAAKSARGGGGGVTFLTEATVVSGGSVRTTTTLKAGLLSDGTLLWPSLAAPRLAPRPLCRL